MIDAATAVREKAHAPYSNFRVGAALRAADGSIFPGCNVENRTFGLTVCAERSAVLAAVAAGQRTFDALVVITDCSPAALPCGLCLETLTEFAQDLPILVTNLAGERHETTLRKLFPTPFEWPETARPVSDRAESR